MPSTEYTIRDCSFSKLNHESLASVYDRSLPFLKEAIHDSAAPARSLPVTRLFPLGESGLRTIGLNAKCRVPNNHAHISELAPRPKLPEL